MFRAKPKDVASLKAVKIRELLRQEAAIGGQLFGPVPAGGKRQFFCLDEHSCVWYEEWTDHTGQRRTLTTRYEIRPTGILKTQGNNTYHYVDPQEETNLLGAIKLYYQRVMREIYNRAV
ncbi:MAG TPA: hypothetical protein VGA08_03270 [Candidatus Saccharimonadales bacterium]